MGKHSHGKGSDDTTPKTPPKDEKEKEDAKKGTPESEKEDKPGGDVSPVLQDNDGEKNKDDEETKDEGTPREQSNTEDPEQNPDEQQPDPREFNGAHFLDSIAALNEHLQSDTLRHIDEDFPVDEVQKMVMSVTGALEGYRAYAEHSRAELDKVRLQLKDVKDRIYKKIHTRPHDHTSGERVSLEERELQARLTQLNADLARTAEEVVRASQLTTDTEAKALQSALAAEQAAEDAKKIQEDYENRRRAEIEARKAEEEKKALEEQRQREDEERKEAEGEREEARRAKLKKQDDHKALEWESWPTFTYRVGANEFDQGVGCIVRGGDGYREDSVTVSRVSPDQCHLSYDDNEELVGNVIEISGRDEDQKRLQGRVVVALPHCMSRASGMSREAVLKAQHSDQPWKELASKEITFDTYKDLKFVQAEVENPCKLAVMSRFKRDFLHFNKKGGKVISGVDSRVTVLADKGTFNGKENFVLQLQPVDSWTINEIRGKIPEGKGLLTSSSIVSMEWMSQEFNGSVVMTLPCPPNPVKAKKAAAARAAKEAKMKNPQQHKSLQQLEQEEEKSRKRKKKEVKMAVNEMMEEETTRKPPTKWYMGQYGGNEDDENDLLHFVEKTCSGRWHVLENVPLLSTKLDIVQLSLFRPIQKFAVLRTRTNVSPQDAQKLVDTIEHQLSLRSATVILRQKQDDPGQVKIQLTPASRAEKLMKQMTDDGYDTGPDPVDVSIKEGDQLLVNFRGNIRNTEDDEKLQVFYSSNLQNELGCNVEEVDKFLQKSYSVYRGFVQLVKYSVLYRRPNKQEVEQGTTETVKEESLQLLSEHLINLPKSYQQAQEPEYKPLVKAPIRLKTSDGPMNNENLRHLSHELGDEWQLLAHHLNVRRMRIQAIIKNQRDEEGDEGVKYDMLMTWLKKMPHGVNKVDVLTNALHSSGRHDLAKKLKDYRPNSGAMVERHTDHNRTATPSGENKAYQSDNEY